MFAFGLALMGCLAAFIIVALMPFVASIITSLPFITSIIGYIAPTFKVAATSMALAEHTKADMASKGRQMETLGIETALD